jgi:micrococcal nuclease
MMQIEAMTKKTRRDYLIIKQIVDGDGLIVEDIFTKKCFEIRLLGIDAPELKPCRKLIKDEKQTHIAGQLLIELGRMSLNFLLSIAPPKTTVFIITEDDNLLDAYGRTLAYVYLEDGSCLNEKMIIAGYAKPFNDYFCEELGKYQALSLQAKANKQGLFGKIQYF